MFRKAWDTSAEGSSIFILQQKINALRAGGKEWASVKRIEGVTTSKIAAELQIEATKLQVDPFNLEVQESCKLLKEKLVELQHREHLDLQ